MHTKLMVAAGFLFATTTGVAAEAQVDPGDFAVPGFKAGNQDNLAARQPMTKKAWVSVPRNAEVEYLFVKFRDHVRARPTGDGGVASLANNAMNEIDGVMRDFDVSFRSVFEQDFATLRQIERKAEAYSGKQQPDLAGMMYVDWPGDMDLEALEEMANAINQVASVEYVEFIPELTLHSSSQTINPAAMRNAVASTTTGTMAGPPPNMVDLQFQNRFFDDLNGNGTFDFAGPYWQAVEYIGGLDIQAMRDTGQFLIDNNDLHPTWDPSKNGARGATINVGVLEFSANLDHVDLDVKLEPGQELLPVQLVGLPNVNHGTATLGELVAKDHGLPGPDRFREGDNAEVGMIGLVPDAQGWFFPSATRQGGSRLASAAASAIRLFNPGDVMSFSVGFGGVGPLVTSGLYGTLFGVASSSGISVVMSAGNDCIDLDETEFPAGKGGAFIIGAGSPAGTPSPLTGNVPYFRRGFSNHFIEETSRIDAQAWGQNVATLGFGDLYGNPGDLSTMNEWYTQSFSGTSSAAPMIAGIIASTQGLTKMFFGTPLSPGIVAGVAVGPQLLQEAQPAIPLISGSLPEPPCTPCVEACYDPLEDSRRIFGFPAAKDYFDGGPSIIESLFTSNPFGDSNLRFAQVLHGQLITGAIQSLFAADGAVMLVESQFVEVGRKSGTNPFPAPTYFVTGQLTDVGVFAEALTPSSVQSVTLGGLVAGTMGGVGFVGGEMFNYTTDRYDWFGIQQIATGDVFNDFTFNTNFAGRNYVDLSNGRMIARVWLYAFGFGSSRFIGAYDEIRVIDGNTGFGGGVGGL